MSFFSTLFSVFRKNNDVAEISTSQVIQPIDFERDILFLTFLMDTQIETEMYRIKLSNKKVLSDNDVIEITGDISEKVVTRISDNYRKVLAKYMPEDEINKFIIDLVIRKMVEASIKHNSKTI